MVLLIFGFSMDLDFMTEGVLDPLRISEKPIYRQEDKDYIGDHQNPVYRIVIVICKTY